MVLEAITMNTCYATFTINVATLKEQSAIFERQVASSVGCWARKKKGFTVIWNWDCSTKNSKANPTHAN